MNGCYAVNGWLILLGSIVLEWFVYHSSQSFQTYLSEFLDPHDWEKGILDLGEDVNPGVLPQEDVVLNSLGMTLK